MEEALASVRVLCRAHLPEGATAGEISLDPTKNAVSVFKPKSEMGHVNNQVESFDFQFDRVFGDHPPAPADSPADDASQAEIFREGIAPTLKSFVSGVNTVVLGYGGVSAGKTHTLCGSTRAYRLRGAIPRTLEEVFQHVKDTSRETETKVEVTFLEIYNEIIRDLLSKDKNHPDVKIEDVDGAAVVRNLTTVTPQSAAEGMEHFFRGLTRRTVVKRGDGFSNRGHCIFSIYLTKNSRVDSTAETVESKLHLVDLAAPERGGIDPPKNKEYGLSKEDKHRHRETGYINRSLAFLEQVVVTLADDARRTVAAQFKGGGSGQSGDSHIPFRSSALTNILRDSLGPKNRCLLIANISLTAAAVDDSIATLRFASRMSAAKTVGKGKVNKRETLQQTNARQQKEIEALRAELRMHDALVGVNSVSREPFSDGQKQGFRDLIESYCSYETDIQVSSLRQVNELLEQFREMVSERKSAAEGIDPRKGPAGRVAKDDTRPSTARSNKSQQKTPEPPKESPKPAAEETAATDVPGAGADEETLPTRGEAFATYLETDEGKAKQQQCREQSDKFRDVNTSLQEVTEKLRNSKAEIDRMRRDLEQKKSETRVESRFAQLFDESNKTTSTDGGVRIMDEEEFELRSQLADVKAQYREFYESRQAYSEQVQALDAELGKTTDEMLEAFTNWCYEEFGQAFPSPQRADQFLFGSEPEPVGAEQLGTTVSSSTKSKRQPDAEDPAAAVFYAAVAKARQSRHN